MCMQRTELTSQEAVEQALRQPTFCQAVIPLSPAERLNDLLGKPVGLGLPAAPLDLKETWSMEEVFTIVYALVDDIYKKLFVTQAYFRRSPNAAPVFTDAEVITLALVQELAGYESQHAWWQYVAKNYRRLFPHLCDRTRYGRRLRQLRSALEQLRRQLLFLTGSDLSRLCVVDSFPISLCHLRRLSGSSCPFEYCATVGYCAAKKESFYGLRLHVMTDARGIVVGYVLSAGHVHDTKGLAFLLTDLAQIEPLLERAMTLLGDKGYVGEKLARQLREEFGVELLAMQREYQPEYGPLAYNELVGGARKIVETTISVLTGVMNANWTYARSLRGFLTSLVTKITALTLGNYLNLLMGEPPLQISSIVN
jgi:hypothetical protein